MPGPLIADTLLKNAYVVTVDSDRRVFTNGYVAFRDGQVVAVGSMSDCSIEASEVLDCTGKVVLPGFTNAHNHLIQVFFRGYNDDRWPVLNFPAAITALLKQQALVAGRLDEERSYILARLHALDLIHSGYIGTHDEHFSNADPRSVDGSWRALEESGMRGFLARCIVNGDKVPEADRETVDVGLKEVQRLKAKFDSSRIEVASGILNYQYLADPEDMRRIAEASAAANIRLDVDMTDNSRGKALEARGFKGGQVEYYRDYGILERPMYAGKAVNVRADEIDILAEHDARVGFVPILRQFDAVGLPVHHFLARGIVPGLGTDGPMVSDSQNVFELMRQTILTQNLAALREQRDGQPLPDAHLWATSETVIEMASLGSARTLFMDDVTGSIEVGKAADCVIADLNRATMRPTQQGRRTLGVLVWAGAAEAVDTIFVEGRKLLEGGRSTIWDEDEVIRDAERVLAEIAEETDLFSLMADRGPGRQYRGWTYI
ncbi:MAG: amidohydrolase family protein [Rhodospirillaceae bacterium]|jgi:5-methylthioadenosine/S-adenosylhomocysteine deaminase|nr:amidohydrolase family protein [Rhodospirillaceae bacterium]MBT5240044.1 amidohydrolase family protein [Rhodospirillaceae bacterium]MBT5566395.1 amidohydrolase family protein [Rhodospirillaceae bacterium]MBT6088881.1 amidohydrolase family protein [Rhodospirillaceae bacterium]MBT6960475.1 amidohydrolase family protein [Rhodospirillaceae bacterium]